MSKELSELYRYLKGDDFEVQNDLTATVTMYSVIPTVMRNVSYSANHTAQMDPTKQTIYKVLVKLQKTVMDIAKSTMSQDIYKKFADKANSFFATQKLNMYDKEHITRALMIILSIIAAQTVRIYATDKNKGAEIIARVKSQFETIRDSLGKIIPEFKGGSLIDGAIKNLQNIGQTDHNPVVIREVRKLEKYQEIKLWMATRTIATLELCNIGSEQCLQSLIDLSEIFDEVSCNTRIRMMMELSPEKFRRILIKLGFHHAYDKVEHLNLFLQHSPFAKTILQNPKLENLLRLLIERVNQQPQKGGINDNDRLYDLLKDLKRLESELGKKKFVIPINMPMSIYVPLNFSKQGSTELPDYSRNPQYRQEAESSLLLHLINKLKKSLQDNQVTLNPETERILNANIEQYKKLDTELIQKITSFMEYDKIHRMMGTPFNENITEIQGLIDRKNELAQMLIKNALCMLNACIEKKN